MHPNPLIIGLLNEHPSKIKSEDFRACGLIEVRFDLIDGFCDNIENSVHLIRNKFPNHSLMATIRLQRDGGKWPTEQSEDRLNIFKKILKSGEFEWLDFELEEAWLMELREMALEYDTQILVSHHNFNQSYSESELTQLTEEIELLGASAAKFALHFQNAEDEVELYQFLDNRQDDFVFAAFSMGELGRVSRVIAPILGASGTYGYHSELPSAPGQWKISHLVEFFRQYHSVNTIEEAKSAVVQYLASKGEGVA